MSMSMISLVAPLLFLPLALGPAPVGDDEALAADIESYLDGLHAGGFAGTVLVLHRGERLVEGGRGFANREEETPWTTRTHATIGSISKQFTGAAILKLEEQGKLSVDDPLSKYLEEYPEEKGAITLHHLLTHSSGLRDFGARDDTWVERDELVYTVLEKPLQFEPGSRYEYSNAGYSILAAVVELVSGRDYETFVREELFLPAGMRETGFHQPDFDRERLVVGYPGGERWGTMLDDMYFEEGPSWVLLGNGGMYSTAEDMLLWMRGLTGGKVLSPASMKKLWGRHVDESNGAGASFYGYGWSLFDAPGERAVVAHNGNDAGASFFNDLMWIPEEETLLFLQTNTYDDGVEDLLQKLLLRITADRELR